MRIKPPDTILITDDQHFRASLSPFRLKTVLTFFLLIGGLVVVAVVDDAEVVFAPEPLLLLPSPPPPPSSAIFSDSEVVLDNDGVPAVTAAVNVGIRDSISARLDVTVANTLLIEEVTLGRSFSGKSSLILNCCVILSNVLDTSSGVEIGVFRMLGCSS